MTQRAILFTGLVRDPVRFNALLDTIVDCRRHFELPIIVSTWRDELAKYPEILARLKGLGVHIVEQNPPNLVLSGHILHQIACIDLGLDVLDDKCFVLKLRPDISNSADITDFLATAPIAAPRTRAMPSPFQEKLHIRAFFAAHPFYINDITIAGSAGDMRLLCRLPFLTPLRYSRLGPEQLLWAPPFIQDIPVLDAYLRANVGLIFNNPDQFALLRNVLLGEPIFARAIACSMIAMQENFAFLGADPLQPTSEAVARGMTLEDMLWAPSDLPHFASHPTCYTNGIRTIGLVDAIITGAYAPSPFGEAVAAAISRYSRPGAITEQKAAKASLHAEAARLAARVEQEVGIIGMKAVHDAPAHRQTQGAQGNWSIVNPGDRTAALDVEINMLRRTIDGLNQRLRAAGV